MGWVPCWEWVDRGSQFCLSTISRCNCPSLGPGESWMQKRRKVKKPRKTEGWKFKENCRRRHWS